jgi:hypothetical protein
MKKPSPEIMRGIVGGAFLMRTLDGVSSLAMLTTFASGREDALYVIIFPIITILVAAPISAAYLFSVKSRCVYWITIIALLLTIAVSIAGTVSLSSSPDVSHQGINLSTASSFAIKTLFSMLLLYLVVQIRRNENGA